MMDYLKSFLEPPRLFAVALFAGLCAAGMAAAWVPRTPGSASIALIVTVVFGVASMMASTRRGNPRPEVLTAMKVFLGASWLGYAFIMLCGLA